MFEISILCVIVLAAGYWAALWLMGRHDDVLHGDFVHAEPRPEPHPAPLPTMHVPAAQPSEGGHAMMTLPFWSTTLCRSPLHPSAMPGASPSPPSPPPSIGPSNEVVPSPG